MALATQVIEPTLADKVDALLEVPDETWSMDCAEFLLCPPGRSVQIARDLTLRELMKVALERRRRGLPVDPVTQHLCENLEMYAMEND